MEFKDISGLLKSPLDKILSLVGDELKQAFNNRIIEYQNEEYKRNYYSKTILHRAEPKSLDAFYIPLKIRKIEKNKHTSKKTLTDSCKKLFQKQKYITLIGSAGSGKSTLVKYLFINCIDEGFKIPIKVELRYLNDYNGTITSYIFDEIFKYQKLGASSNIVERLLDTGNFIFFFDGYDELSSTIKKQVTIDIDNFVKRFNSNLYLITSRPYTNIDLLPLFTNYQVCDLEDGEIATFVKKQLPADENEIAEKIIRTINKPENMGYRTFLSNPLLLSMFILTFQSYADVPQKRSDFYDQVFDTLFSVHDSMSKLAYVREKQSNLSKEQFEEILRLFSFLSFFEEKFLFPQNYIEDKLTLIKDKKKNIIFDNTKFITDLTVAIGILNIEGLDYTFPHRSLQEYFAASYIEHLNIKNKKTIYTKLRTEINKGIFNLFQKEHFYRLLSEMDYYYVTTELTLPILNDILDSLTSTSDIDKEKAYKTYGKLLLVYHVLLFKDEFHDKTHTELIQCDGVQPRFVFYRSGSNDIDLLYPGDIEDKSMSKEIEFEKLQKVVIRFKENGGELIKSIRYKLEELNKSDEAIIDLI